MKQMLLTISLFSFFTCSERPPQPMLFNSSVKVEIRGYSGNAMEPFITRDGKYLFFNNLNAAPENTNLHYAERISDTEFDYKGEIANVNTADIEGTPTMDQSGNLYFVSTREYFTTFSTIYKATFSSGLATSISVVNGVSKGQPGLINFDVEVDASGDFLYFVDATMDANSNPTSADLVIAKRNGQTFERMSNSSALLKNINTTQLEYAASISLNGLELFFTRVAAPITSASSPEIFFATRTGIDAAFGEPIKIESLSGFVEAPSVSSDGQLLYFHQKDGNVFQIYVAKR